MWKLDYKESSAPKNWCFWTVVLEKTLESPLDCKEIQLVHPKGNQSWIFIGRTDAEAETPILWPPDAKNWLIWKDPGCWERLKAGGERNDRWWDGWMASPTQWMWVWVSSGSWWWTGKPGVLQSMWSQRVGHDWATELNWTNKCLLKDSGMSMNTGYASKKKIKYSISKMIDRKGDVWWRKKREMRRGWIAWDLSLIVFLNVLFSIGA